MNANMIRFIVKVKTEHGGTHRYAALFARTGDALMDAYERFHGFGACVITIKAMP